MPGLMDQQLDLRHLRKSRKTLTLSATAKDCQILRDRLELRAVNKVDATLSFERISARRGILVSGEITADIVQACVITLADVPERASATIDVRFVDEKFEAERAHQDMDHADDDVEYFSGDFIDLSEILMQYLAVEINPYPRALGVAGDEEFSYSTASAKELAEDTKPHPFAELKKLQDKT
jgi:uncharacterized metal-binding protein YceD (DUF177 family)